MERFKVFKECIREIVLYFDILEFKKILLEIKWDQEDIEKTFRSIEFGEN